MFDPECLSSLRSLSKEEALDSIKSCFLELFVQLGEIGDSGAPSYFKSYMDWLKGPGIEDPGSELMKAFSQSVTLLEMHGETIRSIQEDVRGLLKSIRVDGQKGREGIEYNQFVETDFKEALRSKNILSNFRCEDCGSTNTVPRALISHSASVESMIQLFTFLLPDLTGLKLLDIGSGLGSILYGAYYFSKAREICGVELNRETCDILGEVMRKHLLTDRVKVVCADLLTQGELFREADVVVFNNVLEYFAGVEVQKEIWLFLREKMKPGCIFVTNPELKTLLEPLGLESLISKWVSPLPAVVDGSLLKGFPETDEIFCVYRVNDVGI